MGRVLGNLKLRLLQLFGLAEIRSTAERHSVAVTLVVIGVIGIASCFIAGLLLANGAVFAGTFVFVIIAAVGLFMEPSAS